MNGPGQSNPIENLVADPTRYRRSPHLVCYWKHGRFVFHNYATRSRAGASPFACDILEFFADWKSLENLFEYKPDIDRDSLAQLVSAMVKTTLLQQSDRPSPQEEAMSKFERWNPEAGFFHSSTKDVKFTDRKTANRQLQKQAEHWPMPPPVKRYPGAKTIRLSPPDRGSPAARAILGRRSWRRFGQGTIPLSMFSTLLGLTAGVQEWVTVPSGQKVALKTSPSGGARHPVELYTLAWGIHGLEPGLYHYVADVHVLEVVKPGVDSSRVPSYVPFGEYWSDACAMIFFSAVYDRDLWRYGYSRAYRAPLIEAGHLAQTFCVLASSHGLAPFCAMALADSEIERDLGLDGVSESVLYMAGVGVRPAGVRWAPAPEGVRVPAVESNPSLQPARAARKPRSNRSRRTSS